MFGHSPFHLDMRGRRSVQTSLKYKNDINHTSIMYESVSVLIFKNSLFHIKITQMETTHLNNYYKQVGRSCKVKSNVNVGYAVDYMNAYTRSVPTK